NSGNNSLADVLDEIAGLKQGGVKVIVWNDDSSEPDPDMLRKQNFNLPPGVVNVESKIAKGLKFDVIDVHYKNQGRRTVASYLKNDPHEAGWMRLNWNESPKINVRTEQGGQAGPQLGAGVTVIKQVRGFGLPLITKNVVATSYAYVVPGSGDSGI